MKKKNILIIIIVLIIFGIILIPVVNFSQKKSIVIPELTDKDIEEANQKERERLVKEKIDSWEEQKNDTQQNIVGLSEEESATIDEEAKKAEEGYKKFDAIITKYAPEEFKKAKEDMANVGSQGLVDLSDQLPKEEVAYYDVILNVLETKNMSKEDREFAIETIKGVKSEICRDSGLKERVEKILN